MFKAFGEQLSQAEFEMEKIIEKKCVNWFGLLNKNTFRISSQR